MHQNECLQGKEDRQQPNCKGSWRHHRPPAGRAERGRRRHQVWPLRDQEDWRRVLYLPHRVREPKSLHCHAQG